MIVLSLVPASHFGGRNFMVGPAPEFCSNLGEWFGRARGYHDLVAGWANSVEPAGCFRQRYLRQPRSPRLELAARQ